VGTISGFALVFFLIVIQGTNRDYCQFYSSLLSNTAWFGNNAGTFEKFTGTFLYYKKQVVL
jgi:hypothetical protein